MTVGEIQGRVKRQFGDETGVQITDEDIIRWINDAQIDLTKKADILTKTVLSNTMAGLVYYFLEVDFLRIEKVEYHGRILRFVTTNELDRRYPNRNEEYPLGTPEMYAISKKAIFLYPGPSINELEVLAITYVARPTPVSTSTQEPDLPVEYHEQIVDRCLQRAYELDGNWTAVGVKKADYREGVLEAKAEADWPNADSYPSVGGVAGDEYY